MTDGDHLCAKAKDGRTGGCIEAYVARRVVNCRMYVSLLDCRSPSEREEKKEKRKGERKPYLYLS